MQTSNNKLGGDRTLTTYDQVDSQIGEQLAEMLGLKVSTNGRIQTSWGSKTFVGLTRSIENLIKEARDHAEVCDSNLM